MTAHLYTPAQITIPAHSEDHIRVVGGKVWDFSRFSLATPVVVVRDGKKAGARPAQHCRCFQVRFAPGSSSLREATKWRLLELPRNRLIWVAFGASSLARMRAQAVSDFLRTHGRDPVLRRLYRDGGGGNEVLVLVNSRDN
ncbi:MAG: hypothetical protein ACP5P4_12840 [Steroidobacteraceae bacterium]